MIKYLFKKIYQILLRRASVCGIWVNYPNLIPAQPHGSLTQGRCSQKPRVSFPLGSQSRTISALRENQVTSIFRPSLLCLCRISFFQATMLKSLGLSLWLSAHLYGINSTPRVTDWEYWDTDHPYHSSSANWRFYMIESAEDSADTKILRSKLRRPVATSPLSALLLKLGCHSWRRRSLFLSITIVQWCRRFA